MKTSFISFLALMAFGPFVQAYTPSSAYTPAPGTPERQEMMDLCRMDYYKNNLTKAQENSYNIEFLVHYLKTNRMWFCAKITATQATQKGLQASETEWVLFRKVNKNWKQVDLNKELEPKTEIEQFNLLGLNKEAIRRLKKKFPESSNVLPDPKK